MRGTRLGRQGDLFAPQPDLFDQAGGGAAVPPGEEEAPPEFVARLRAELHATLARVQAAERLPFRDLTRAALAEMRFHSISRTWLPPGEAEALRAAFEKEMARLYAAEDAAAEQARSAAAPAPPPPCRSAPAARPPGSAGAPVEDGGHARGGERLR